MQRWKKYLILLSFSGPVVVLPSCGTLLATSMRDAAVEGTATFVQAATTELLNRWFDTASQD